MLLKETLEKILLDVGRHKDCKPGAKTDSEVHLL
jgi:hypothetical protein